MKSIHFERLWKIFSRQMVNRQDSSFQSVLKDAGVMTLIPTKTKKHMVAVVGLVEEHVE